MDKSLLKKAAIQSVALMIAVVTSSYALQQYQTVAIYASNLAEDTSDTISQDQTQVIELFNNDVEEEPIYATTVTGTSILATSLKELKDQMKEDILSQLSDNYLVIKKPEAQILSLQLEDIYINRSLQLNLTGLSDMEINSEMILRVRGEEFYHGDPTYTERITQEIDEDNGSTTEVITRDYGKDPIYGITVTSQPSGSSDAVNTQVLIELDSVYAYFLYEDDNYYYIDLRKPSDIYDKILVIDAGHGGKDAGALSKGKEYYEKNINLGIALQLKKLLELEDIKVYYTRSADDKVFLRPRVNLANAVDCDYFISIHCNSNEVTSPNGTEVLYYDNVYKKVAAKELAKLFSEELESAVELRNRGIIEKHVGDIFIMDKSLVPMILIEIGYLSNNNDLNYLLKQENQLAVAQGIYNGILRAYEEMPSIR